MDGAVFGFFDAQPVKGLVKIPAFAFAFFGNAETENFFQDFGIGGDIFGIFETNAFEKVDGGFTDGKCERIDKGRIVFAFTQWNFQQLAVCGNGMGEIFVILKIDTVHLICSVGCNLGFCFVPPLLA